MFVPNLFPDISRKKIRQVFFGSEFLPSLLIITPISSLFDSWSKLGKASEGWWRTSRVGEVLFVKSPQSTAILDIICSLEPNVSVIYAGISGSCGQYQLGDVVEVGTAVYENIIVETSWKEKSPFPVATIATVSCLAESYQLREKIAARADCVDMETGLLFLTAKEHNINVRSIQVISDSLFDEPFYKVNRQFYIDGLEIIKAYVSEYVIDYINSKNKSLID